MKNTLIGMDKSGSYRVYLAVTTEMTEEARRIHDTTPLATAGLGRVLTAAGLMGLMLKNTSDKLTVLIKGDGPAKQIMATADGDGNVKGYIANPDVDLPLTDAGKLDVGGSLGIGELTVIRDMGIKEPYVGTIALVNGEIAEDLAAYFFISEQQNTSVALGVKVERDRTVAVSGGMIVQMLPGAEEGAIDALEERMKTLPPLTEVIESTAAATTETEKVDGEQAVGGDIDDPTDNTNATDAINIGDGAIEADGNDTITKSTAVDAADIKEKSYGGTDIAGNVNNQAGDTEDHLGRIVDYIFGSMPEDYRVEAKDMAHIGWNCDCNRERLEKALLSIGEKDLREILEEDGQAELQCQFCLKKYFFNKEELEKLLEEAGGR